MLKDRVNRVLAQTKCERDAQYTSLVEEFSKFTHNERFRLDYTENESTLILRTFYDEGEWRAEKILLRVVKQPNATVIYDEEGNPFAVNTCYQGQDIVDALVDILVKEGVFQV